MTGLICYNGSKVLETDRQVKIKQGIIEGIRLVDDGTCQVDAFLGIPFAKPPIGPLRFKKPEPPESWKGVRKVKKFAPCAPQPDFLWARLGKTIKRSEDCLYLNVFAPAWQPSNEQKNGFAVMVYIHGGAFMIDSAVRYGDVNICNNLCRRNVIVVTIQYRLGLLGFFCTGDKVCPGNNGLWDQAMALQWVKENISAFNGNPECITVFGQSAGGVCADLLSLSPKSRDLFQQVIAMSGNAECDWAIAETERIVVVCKRFAKRVGWKKNGTGEKYHEEMLNYLRTLPAATFERFFFGHSIWINASRTGLILAPVIDGDFLPKSIEQLRNDAPMKNCIIGTCKYETLILAAISLSTFTLRDMDRILRDYFTAKNYDNYDEVRVKVKNYYITNIDMNDKLAIAHACEKLSSDLFVRNATAQYVNKMMTLGHKVYLYSFDYFNPRSYSVLSLILPFKGATHCTELNYIFGANIFPLPFKCTKADKYMRDEVAKLWTNFAKFGNPNVSNLSTAETSKWLSVTTKPACYFSIAADSFQMKNEYCSYQPEIWCNYGNDDGMKFKSTLIRNRVDLRSADQK